MSTVYILRAEPISIFTSILRREISWRASWVRFALWNNWTARERRPPEITFSLPASLKMGNGLNLKPNVNLQLPKHRFLVVFSQNLKAMWMLPSLRGFCLPLGSGGRCVFRGTSTFALHKPNLPGDDFFSFVIDDLFICLPGSASICCSWAVRASIICQERKKKNKQCKPS